MNWGGLVTVTNSTFASNTATTTGGAICSYQAAITISNSTFDGNKATAWMPDKGGVGESISVHFKSPATIASVSILNSVGVMAYKNHNRVHTMRMTYNDGATQMLTFEDKMMAQRFEVQHPAPVESIKFEILSVFPGEKNTHIPIAEIVFNRDITIHEPGERQQFEPRPRRSLPPKSKY